MRRIYHRFPTTIDLEFEIARPFGDVIGCIQRLHTTHTTTKQGADLVKRAVLVKIATNKTGFETLDDAGPFEGRVTEAVDFQIRMQDSILKSEGRMPASVSTFFVRITDKGGRCECLVAKDGSRGVMNAMDLKTQLAGACQ